MKKNKIISVALAAGILMGSFPMQAFAITGSSSSVSVYPSNSIMYFGDYFDKVPMWNSGATIGLRYFQLANDKCYLSFECVSLSAGNNQSVYIRGFSVNVTSGTGSVYTFNQPEAGMWKPGRSDNPQFEVDSKIMKEGIKSVSFYNVSAGIATFQPTGGGYMSLVDDKPFYSGGGGSKNPGIIVYPKVAPETVTGTLDIVKANSSNIPNSNGLNQTQISNYLSANVDSSIAFSLSNYKYAPATDKSSGAYTGVVTVTKGAESQVFNLNIVIPQLTQSTNTAKIAIKNLVDAYAVTNLSTKGELLTMCQNAVGSNITVTIPSWTLGASTETSKGSLIGSIGITDGNTSDVVSISKVIGVTEQSIDTIYTMLNNYCENYNANNNSIENDLINALVITNSNYSIALDSWSLTPSTDKVEGSLSCNVNIKENGIIKKTINVNKTINKLAQSAETAKSNLIALLGNLKVSNNTTEQDVLSAVQVGTDSTKVNIGFGTGEGEAFSLTKATEQSKGTIKGAIVVSDGVNSETVPVNLIIEELDQSAETAKSNLIALLGNLKVSNNTTEQDVLNVVKVGTDSTKVNLTFGTGEGEAFSLTKATEQSKGTIKGAIVVSDGVNSETVPVNLIIEKLPQSVETIKSTFMTYLKNIKVTNDTEKEDFINAISVSNENISVTMPSFNKIKATDLAEGNVTGQIIITDDVNTQTIDINEKIDKLAQTAETAESNINAVLGSFKATNETLETDVLNAVKVVTDQTSITVAFGTGESETFNKIKASEKDTGSVKGVIYVKDKSDNTVAIPVDKIIDKLPQSLDTVYTLFTAYLNNVEVKNNTEKEDFINAVSVTNKDVKVTMPAFDKTIATETAEGKIIGQLSLTDDVNIMTIDVDKIISKLEQTVESVKTKIEASLGSFTATNSTIEQDVINAVKTNITDSNITVAFGTAEGQAFKKVDATTSAPGKITGTIIITKGEEKVEVPVDVAIAQLPSTPVVVVPTTPVTTVPTTTGGSGGSSGGSSSSSSDTITIDDKVNNQTNAASLGWRNENGAWHYYGTDGKLVTGWLKIDGLWYFFDENGVLKTGWLNLNANWYYLNPTPGQTLGAMLTGWQQVNSTWYYLNPSIGAAEGIMQTGWNNINGYWYFLDASGAMKTGWLNNNGTWYYLKNSGEMVTGWFNDSDGNWYYLDSSGAMLYDTTIDGYDLGSNGAWLQ